MEKQWTHDKSGTCTHFAGEGFGIIDVRGDIVLIDTTKFVRTADHSQRPVCSGARVQMNPDRDHPIENLSRWLDVNDAFFYGPWPEAFCLCTNPDSDRDVLMPRDFPISRAGLIEEG